jgi:hypothetical protein
MIVYPSEVADDASQRLFASNVASRVGCALSRVKSFLT